MRFFSIGKLIALFRHKKRRVHAPKRRRLKARRAKERRGLLLALYASCIDRVASNTGRLIIVSVFFEQWCRGKETLFESPNENAGDDAIDDAGADDDRGGVCAESHHGRNANSSDHV